MLAFIETIHSNENASLRRFATVALLAGVCVGALSGCGASGIGDDLDGAEARRAASTEVMTLQAVEYEAANEDTTVDVVSSILAASTGDAKRNPVHGSRQKNLRKSVKKHAGVIAAIRRIAQQRCTEVVQSADRADGDILRCVYENVSAEDKPRLSGFLQKMIEEVDDALVTEYGIPNLENVSNSRQQ